MSDKLEQLSPGLKKIFLAYPVRNPVRWYKRKGIAVVVYPKNLTRFEKGLQKAIGGPDVVRRTMDEKGTVIWELCDGRHNVKEICDIIDSRYREEVEPVFEYVQKVLVVLLERNLLRLEETKPERPLPVRKQRVIKR